MGLLIRPVRYRTRKISSPSHWRHTAGLWGGVWGAVLSCWDKTRTRSTVDWQTGWWSPGSPHWDLSQESWGQLSYLLNILEITEQFSILPLTILTTTDPIKPVVAGSWWWRCFPMVMVCQAPTARAHLTQWAGESGDSRPHTQPHTQHKIYKLFN